VRRWIIIPVLSFPTARRLRQILSLVRCFLNNVPIRSCGIISPADRSSRLSAFAAGTISRELQPAASSRSAKSSVNFAISFAYSRPAHELGHATVGVLLQPFFAIAQVVGGNAFR